MLSTPTPSVHSTRYLPQSVLSRRAAGGRSNAAVGRRQSPEAASSTASPGRRCRRRLVVFGRWLKCHIRACNEVATRSRRIQLERRRRRETENVAPLASVSVQNEKRNSLLTESFVHDKKDMLSESYMMLVHGKTRLGRFDYAMLYGRLMMLLSIIEVCVATARDDKYSLG